MQPMLWTAMLLAVAGCMEAETSAPDSGPSLVRIEMTPALAGLSVGATQAFEVIGYYDDETTAPVSPTFVATGGTVDGGVYTAATGGTFLLIANGAGGVADTSLIATAPLKPEGSTVRFESVFDETHAQAGAAWDYRDHLVVALVDGNDALVGAVGFWVTEAGADCTVSHVFLTCPAGTHTITFQQVGVDGVDNPGFRPQITLIVE